MRLKYSNILFLLLISGFATRSTAQLVKTAKVAQMQQVTGNSSTEGRLSQLLALIEDSTISKAQQDSCMVRIGDLRTFLADLPFTIELGSSRKDKLISNFAFRKLVKDNFSKTVLGLDDVAKIDRYATLDIANDIEFDFSPYTWSLGNGKKLSGVLGINVSGKLNSDGYFGFKDWRDLKLNVSWVRLFNKTNFQPKDKDVNDIRVKAKCDLVPEKFNELIDEYEEGLQKNCDNKCLTGTDVKKGRDKVSADFLEKLTDLEIAEFEKHWRIKSFSWISLNAGLKRDVFQFLSDANYQQNIFEPVDEEQFTPELNFAYNRFLQHYKGFSYLVNFYGGVKLKHSLSEVYVPSEFRSIRRLNDSLIEEKELSSVFITDFETVNTKVVVDFGFRTVVMTPYLGANRKQQVGLSFKLERNSLVGINGPASSLSNEIGFVIPLLQPDGETKINIEIFRRSNRYRNIDAEDLRTWGFRFNVPIGGN